MEILIANLMSVFLVQEMAGIIKQEPLLVKQLGMLVILLNLRHNLLKQNGKKNVMNGQNDMFKYMKPPMQVTKKQ
jgi:hypothetical protein